VAELLATYGRGGILAVRPGPREACEACVDKECAAAQYRYRFDARSCPTLLNPARLAGSRDCLLCTQCIKSCRSANMRLLLRTPFPAGDLRSALASWPTTIFVMLISGFVTWELTTEWKTAEALFLAAPRWVSRQLGLTAAAGYVNGVWALAAVPLAVWTLLSFAARLTRRASGLVDAWRRLALPLAVIVAAGQMAKALSKFTSWVGFLPLAASRPDGLETARAITAKELATPAPWLPLAWVSAAGMVLVTAALLFAIREARLAGSRAWLPQALLAAGFLFIIAGWA
jgi:NAD-dependent dihydropyrimidine dehydrogenase PreA subunit